MRAINHAGRQVRPRCLVVEDSRFDQERFRRILNLNFAAMEVVLTARLSEARAAMRMIAAELGLRQEMRSRRPRADTRVFDENVLTADT